MDVTAWWNWGNDATFSEDMSSEKGTLKKFIDFFWGTILDLQNIEQKIYRIPLNPLPPLASTIFNILH